MINSRASGTFSFDANNHLVHSSDSSGKGGQSSYYESRLVEAIDSPKNINLDISPTFDNGVGASVQVDGDHGGGVTYMKGNNTTDRWVTISGNENSTLRGTNGRALTDTAGDILAHELVGHAIPQTVGTDTGNAVTNENKVRTQNGGRSRAAEPYHTEIQ